MLHDLFCSNIQNFLRSDQLKIESGFPNFKKFAQKTIGMKHLNESKLDADGFIRPEVLEENPCLFSFIKIDYAPEFMLEEEARSFGLTNEQFSSLISNELKWTLDDF